MKRVIAGLVVLGLVLGLLTTPTPAFAHRRGHFIGGFAVGAVTGAILGSAFVPRYDAPVVVAPAPVYVAPAPVYVAPAPVYVAPSPPVCSSYWVNTYWNGVGWVPGHWEPVCR